MLKRFGVTVTFVVCGVSIMVLFAWSALMAATDYDDSGPAGRLAFHAALMPSVFVQALTEAKDLITGAEQDRYLSVPRQDISLSGFRPVLMEDGIPLGGLLVRGVEGGADRGWRVLGGAMSVQGQVSHAVVLLSPDLTVSRVWHLNEDALLSGNVAAASRKVLHGLQVLPDGSILFSFDHGSSLQRWDACGKPVWTREGLYHHSVVLGDDGRTAWALRNRGFPGDNADRPPQPIYDGFVQIDIGTGISLQEFSVSDIRAANPEISLFGIGRIDEDMPTENSTEVHGKWLSDPFHFNDIEPLPAALASAFPDFQAGDLLISARNLNAIFVIDPQDLRLKWHSVGLMRRQHDPDWQPDGTIRVLNNNMGRGPSQILELDPSTYERRVVFDGAEADFYTRIRGKHMETAHGDLAVVSPQQGRAFEVDESGEMILEFQNFKPGATDTNYVLTEYLWLPEAALNLQEDACDRR